MITVSETAANKLNSLIKESEFKTPFVRVSVKGGEVKSSLISGD